VSVWEVTQLYKASDRDFVEKLWANGVNSVLVDQGANLLIPTDNGTTPSKWHAGRIFFRGTNGGVGGVIVVGEQTISYHSMTWDTFECVIPHPAIFECFTPVDSDDSTEEWILGDSEGRIYSLHLSSDDQDLTIHKLGDVPPPPTTPLFPALTLLV
jgi:Mono-functional DNA-alkylating methyl methanesulfonate N-term